MKVKVTDIVPAVKDLAGDISKKLNPAIDIRNAARIFAINCLMDDAVLLPWLEGKAKAGILTLPSKETAMNALEVAGGSLPFPFDLPMGFSFTVTLNKSDLEKLYAVASAKEIK